MAPLNNTVTWRCTQSNTRPEMPKLHDQTPVEFIFRPSTLVVGHVMHLDERTTSSNNPVNKHRSLQMNRQQEVIIRVSVRAAYTKCWVTRQNLVVADWRLPIRRYNHHIVPVVKSPPFSPVIRILLTPPLTLEMGRDGLSGPVPPNLFKKPIMITYIADEGLAFTHIVSTAIIKSRSTAEMR